jgi:hypothetical protein
MYLTASRRTMIHLARVSAALAAVAVAVLPALPAVRASSGHPAGGALAQIRSPGDGPRSIASACTFDGGFDDGFVDVPSGHVHEREVDCIVYWQIGAGISPGLYRPERAVTRAQVASFLARFVERSGGTLPSDPADAFTDDDGDTHEHAIDDLAAAGIARGRTHDRYFPDEPVTRGQMASLVVRTLEHRLDTEPLVSGELDDHFGDDDGSAHESAIDAAAALGIAGGTTAQTFRPAAPVTRAQVAALLARGLAELVDSGTASVPPPPVHGVSDRFERPDGTLGNGWMNCAGWIPDAFEPLGIRDGAAVVPDPMTRPGEYDSFPPTGHPPPDGKLHHGIGCAWRNTGTDSVSVEVVWAGHRQRPRHVEAAPLVHVSPGTDELGFGMWPSAALGVPFLIIGTIGNPPEDFRGLMAVSVPGGHVDGTPARLRITSDGDGMTFWWNDQQLRLPDGYGLDPYPVPDALRGATRHGFALDAHLTAPDEVPTTPGALAVEVRPQPR